MTPEFANLVNPTFLYVLGLLQRIQRSEAVVLDHERALIRNELEEAEMTANSEQSAVKAEDFQLAKRCLIYWIDEVLTQATREWKEISLEFEYFEEKNRAWRFYTVGETQARRSSADVVEIWYLALVLGFEGDISEAFRDHLARSLPGNRQTSTEARVIWADELRQQLRQRQFPEFPGTPLEGSLTPQWGGWRLQVALVFFAISATAFATIAAFYVRQKM